MRPPQTCCIMYIICMLPYLCCSVQVTGVTDKGGQNREYCSREVQLCLSSSKMLQPGRLLLHQLAQLLTQGAEVGKGGEGENPVTKKEGKLMENLRQNIQCILLQCGEDRWGGCKIIIMCSYVDT